MEHSDHTALLRPAGLPAGGVWADLGAGEGAFTLALRELLGPQAELYAVDREAARLQALERAYRERFGETETLRVRQADLARGLDLPALDGILMANALHFFRDRVAVLEKACALLRPGGRLLLVEYNVDRGNPWVPHPLSFDTFREEAWRAGFQTPRLLATHPSSFLREFYAAVAFKVAS